MSKGMKDKSDMECNFCKGVLDPRDLNSDIKNIMVFDDMLLEKKQNTYGSYYVRTKHSSVD